MDKKYNSIFIPLFSLTVITGNDTFLIFLILLMHFSLSSDFALLPRVFDSAGNKRSRATGKHKQAGTKAVQRKRSKGWFCLKKPH